jgi:hypothetical protein
MSRRNWHSPVKAQEMIAFDRGEHGEGLRDGFGAYGRSCREHPKRSSEAESFGKDDEKSTITSTKDYVEHLKRAGLFAERSELIVDVALPRTFCP